MVRKRKQGREDAHASTYLRLLGGFVAVLGVLTFSSPASAQDGNVTPDYLLWCWNESGGVCMPNCGHSYGADDFDYWLTDTSNPYYDEEIWFVESDAETGIDLVYMRYWIDEDYWEYHVSWVYNPDAGTWHLMNDVVDSNESDGYVSAREYKSSGDSIPDNWDYDGDWIVLTEFYTTDPFAKDLRIWIIGGS